MIGKAKSVRGSVAGIKYLQEENKGYELDRNFILGDTPEEIIREFRMQQTLNTTCDKNMITAVISPHIKDGEKLTNSELKEIGKDFLEKLNIDSRKQAYLMIVHDEKAHKHIHIYANRIQQDGKAINDTYIGKRAQVAAHNIAKERGLISAREIMFENRNKQSIKVNDSKSKIYKAHIEIMNSNQTSLKDYILKMEKKGFQVYPALNKQNKLQGLKVYDKVNDIDFKMSEVNRSMSLNGLLKKGIKNDLNVELKNEIKNISKQTSIDENFNLGINQKDIIGLKPNPSQVLGMVKPLLKEKMTKEEFLEHLKDQEFFDDVINPNLIKEFQENWTEEILKNEVEREKRSDQEIKDEKENKEKDEQSKNNNLEL
jgi:hypothetical protein